MTRPGSTRRWALLALLVLGVVAVLLFPGGREGASDRPAPEPDPDAAGIEAAPGALGPFPEPPPVDASSRTEPRSPDAPPEEPAADAGGTVMPEGVLAGRVLGHDGRRPLEHATVFVIYEHDFSRPPPRVRGRDSDMAGTNAEGAFRFEKLTTGTWILHAQCRGYCPQRLSGLRLADGAKIEDLEVVLIGGPGSEDSVGAVEGRASDRSGRPISDTSVFVTGTAGASDARTDADGRYRVAPLLPGRYRVLLHLPSEGDPRDPANCRSHLPYRMVTVEAGETERVDFGGTGLLRGVLLDGEGKPVPLGSLWFRPVAMDRDGDDLQVRANTDGEGRFSVEGLTPGRYSVFPQWAAAREILVDGGDQEVTIRPGRARIEGRVLLADTGEPPRSPPAHCRLHSLEASEAGGPDRVVERAALVSTAEDGGFEIRGPMPGRYRLVITRDGYRREERDLHVGPGRRISGVDFKLERFRPGTLRIRVTDRDRRPLRWVEFLYRDPEGAWRKLPVESPERGVYVTRRLEPGSWELSVTRGDRRPASLVADLPEGGTARYDVVMAPW